jgi:protein-S-isoprenylcysteine O-methyltransferase Ste14
MPADVETLCRIALGLMMAGAAAIGVPHRLRADRAGGPVSPRVDPRWFWLLMAVVGPPAMLVSVAFLIEPRWVDIAQVRLPPWVRLLGVLFGVAGLGLFAWMFRHLGFNVTSTSMPRSNAVLVTTGPYRWVRHPMYSATLLLGVAAALLTANLVVAAGAAGIFALLAARSGVEEQRLVGKFGATYQAYQRRTGRFLPPLFRRRRT